MWSTTTTVAGKVIGLGDEVDIDITKTLTGNDRKLAQEAFNDEQPYTIHADLVCGAVNLYSLYHFSGMLGELNPLALLLYLVAGIFWVDVLSGTLHLILDNPHFLGSPIDALCRGFQQHHLDTTIICRLGIWEHIHVINAPVAVSGIIGLLVNDHPLQYIYCPLYTAGLWYMQMCHRWAHMKPQDRPAFAVFAQKFGLALSPYEHLQHHKPPYSMNFCISSGWFNPLLNAIVQRTPLTNHSKWWALIFLGAVAAPHIVLKLLV